MLGLVQKYDPTKLKGAESTLGGYLMQKLNRYDATGKRISLIEARVIAEANKIGLEISEDIDTIKEPIVEKEEETPSLAELEAAKTMTGRNTIDRVKLSGELQTKALSAVETTLQTMLPDIGKKVGKNFRNE